VKIDKNYFPGWVRKSISFTIDDGNLVYDKKFIDIVKPKGISGTCNLCLPDLKKHTPEFYREFYAGFGTANHCAHHPFALTKDKDRPVSDEPFSESADESKLYKSGIPGLYHVKVNAGWRYVCDTDTYIEMVKRANVALEEIFGEGSVTEFVWPYGEQADAEVMQYLSQNFESVRKTGDVGASTGFAIPVDMMHWSNNVREKKLLELAEEYEGYSDDGELKFFCFGLHSIDYERAQRWDDLSLFAEKYGARPDTYYYAPVRDIFRYRDAVESLIITDNSIENPSDTDVYVKVDGEQVIVASKSKIAI
jgi:hypothetical protein